MAEFFLKALYHLGNLLDFFARKPGVTRGQYVRALVIRGIVTLAIAGVGVLGAILLSGGNYKANVVWVAVCLGVVMLILWLWLAKAVFGLVRDLFFPARARKRTKGDAP